jgi:hypothetical protein
MASISTPAIITLLIFLALNITALVWVLMLNNRIKECEKKESLFCPFYTCEITDKDCGIASFRYENGDKTKKICSTPLVNSALVKTKNQPNRGS